MGDMEVPYVEIVFRFCNGTKTPAERLRDMQAIAGLIRLRQMEEHEYIEVEIGQHTGPCSPAFCDQANEGFHV